MKYLQGTIKYNEETRGYGIVGDNGWIREKLLPNDDVAVWLESGWFHSQVKGSDQYAYLQPNSFGGWEKLEGAPAAFIDYERTPKTPEPTKTEIRKDAFKLGCFAILLSAGFAAVLGAAFALLFHKERSFVESFIEASKAVYVIFCAGITLGGILMILVPKLANVAIGFGVAVYYGTFLLSAVLSDFVICPHINRLMIAFVIVALACYVVWLKFFENKRKE